MISLPRLLPRLFAARLLRSFFDDLAGAPEIPPLVRLTFEDTGGDPLYSWTEAPGGPVPNEGTAAFTWLAKHVAGANGFLRTTDQAHRGVASCHFTANGGESLQYSGSAMDLGINPRTIWRMFYWPDSAPSSFAHSLYCWGDGVSNRFLPFIVLPDLKVQTYCIVGGSTKWNVVSAAPLVTLGAWNEFVFAQDGAGAIALACNGVSVGGASAAGVDYSQATFGPMAIGKESWTNDNFADGYVDDFEIAVLE